jgi:hypothetical protein
VKGTRLSYAIKVLVLSSVVGHGLLEMRHGTGSIRNGSTCLAVTVMFYAMRVHNDSITFFSRSAMRVNNLGDSLVVESLGESFINTNRLLAPEGNAGRASLDISRSRFHPLGPGQKRRRALRVAALSAVQASRHHRDEVRLHTRQHTLGSAPTH